jgi:hypothetical protein
LQGLPHLSLRFSSKVIVVSASLTGDLGRGVLTLRARGAQVQVFLIDAASLAAHSGDPRFRAHGAKLGVSKVPSQSDGEKSVAVSSANFQVQVARLREVGAVVVCVNASEGEKAETTLRAALRAATPISGMGQISAQ